MKYIYLFMLIGLIGCTQSDKFDMTQPVDFNDWVGSWKHTDGESVTMEAWKKESATAYMGVNLTEKGGKKKMNETITLRQVNGTWVMTPKTAGQNPNPVDFTLVSNQNREVVFANPNHDFPKLITYKMTSREVMVATISDGKDTEISWTFKKQATLEQLGISEDENGRPLLK